MFEHLSMHVNDDGDMMIMNVNENDDDCIALV